MNNRKIIKTLREIYDLVPEGYRSAETEAAMVAAIEAVERRQDYKRLGSMGGSETFERYGKEGMSERGKRGGKLGGRGRK